MLAKKAIIHRNQGSNNEKDKIMDHFCDWCGITNNGGGTYDYGLYFCWNKECTEHGRKIISRITKYIQDDLVSHQKCSMRLSGRSDFCEKPVAPGIGSRFCKKHTHNCAVCGKPATRECGIDTSFGLICGESLCDNCGCPRMH